MAVEICLVRLLEIATFLVFFIICLSVGAILIVTKQFLLVLGILIKPAVWILILLTSQCFDLVSWSLDQALKGFNKYGHHLIE